MTSSTHEDRTTRQSTILVDRANRYVHVPESVATVDPQIESALNPDEVAVVRDSVERFNELSSTTSISHGGGGGAVDASATSDVLPRATAYAWHYDVYWWGVRMWINSPMAQNFGSAMGVVGGAIGGLFGGPPGEILGEILGSVSGDTTARLDNQCGGRGAFVDINWALQVSAHAVCG